MGTFNIILFFVLIFLIILCLSFIIYRRNKREEENAVQEKRKLQEKELQKKEQERLLKERKLLQQRILLEQQQQQKRKELLNDQNSKEQEALSLKHKLQKNMNMEELRHIRRFISNGYIIFIVVDLHHFSLNECKKYLDKLIHLCDGYLVEITLVHGFNHGTKLKEYVRYFEMKENMKRKVVAGNPGRTIFRLDFRKNESMQYPVW